MWNFESTDALKSAPILSSTGGCCCTSFTQQKRFPVIFYFASQKLGLLNWNLTTSFTYLLFCLKINLKMISGTLFGVSSHIKTCLNYFWILFRLTSLSLTISLESLRGWEASEGVRRWQLSFSCLFSMKHSCGLDVSVWDGRFDKVSLARWDWHPSGWKRKQKALIHKQRKIALAQRENWPSGNCGVPSA